MPGAVRGDEVTGDEGAESSGTAGDQDGLIGVDRDGWLIEGRGSRRDDPRHERGALAQGNLGLIRGKRSGQRLSRGLEAVAVAQDEGVGALELSRAQQTPNRGGGKVG